MIFYKHKSHYGKLSVILRGFIIHVCTVNCTLIVFFSQNTLILVTRVAGTFFFFAYDAAALSGLWLSYS